MVTHEQLVRELSQLEERWTEKFTEQQERIDALQNAIQPRLSQIEEKLSYLVVPSDETHVMSAQKVAELNDLLGQVQVRLIELTNLKSALGAYLATL